MKWFHMCKGRYGYLLCILLMTLSLNTGVRAEEAEQPVYADWQYTAQFEWLDIDAQVYGYAQNAKASILRCSKVPFAPEQESGIIDLIAPELFPDLPRDQITLLWERDGTIYEDAAWTVERAYSRPDWQDGDPDWMVFSDGSIFACSKEWECYETVTASTTASVEYPLFVRQWGDLPFAGKDEIIRRASSLLKVAGIDATEAPALMLEYSDRDDLIGSGKALPYREFYNSTGIDYMEPYRRKVSEYGGDLYMLYFGQVIEGIPTSVAGRYFDSADYYSEMPDIQVWYNQNGLIYFRAMNMLSVFQKTEPQPICSVEDAAKTVSDYLNEMIVHAPLECPLIRLEYFALPLEGGKLGMECELIPMWTFYFSDGSSPVIVNAVANQVVW